MALDDLINVTITVESPAVTRAGFGTPAIFDYHTKFAELARSYDSLAGMVSDGFSASDAAYVAAQKIFGQNPRPSKLLVMRRATAPTCRWELTPVVANNAVYSGTVYKLGTAEGTFTFTSDGTATLSEIIAGIVASVNGLPLIANFTATDQTTHVRIEADAPGTHIVLKAVSSNIAVKNATPDASSVADYLSAAAYCSAQGLDFYGLLSTSRGSAELALLAAQIEGEKKLFGFATQDTAVAAGTPGNIALTLSAAGYARTWGIYNEAGAGIYDFAEAALFGRVLPDDPGSETWKWKTLAGITYDALTSTEISNLKTADINHYRREAGRSFTAEGVSFAGEFIDVTRFIDFIHSRMQENIFARLVAVEKVPFTDPGIAIIENEVRGVLQLGINNGGFAADPAPTVTVPKAVDVSPVDKANRFLPDVKFTATLAGAIHSLEIQGTVSV